MSLPVLRVRHHGVIGGRDGDVLVCASVGPAGEVVAVWTTPDGPGAVTSATVSAAGACFPDPAAARPVEARITDHTPELAAVTPNRGPAAGAYHREAHARRQVPGGRAQVPVAPRRPGSQRGALRRGRAGRLRRRARTHHGGPVPAPAEKPMPLLAPVTKAVRPCWPAISAAAHWVSMTLLRSPRQARPIQASQHRQARQHRPISIVPAAPHPGQPGMITPHETKRHTSGTRIADYLSASGPRRGQLNRAQIIPSGYPVLGRYPGGGSAARGCPWSSVGDEGPGPVRPLSPAPAGRFGSRRRRRLQVGDRHGAAGGGPGVCRGSCG